MSVDGALENYAWMGSREMGCWSQDKFSFSFVFKV